MILGTLAAGLGTGVAPETVPVKLNSLARLFCKIVNDHRFCGHFDDVGWMRAVQLRTQQLGKVVLLIFNFLKGWTISSPQWGAGR